MKTPNHFGKRSLATLLALVMCLGMVNMTVFAATADHCGLEEHGHTDQCYEFEDILTCEREESEGHKHGEACYETGTVEEEEKTLICGQEESEGHAHGDECYESVRGDLICGKEEHTHGVECGWVRTAEQFAAELAAGTVTLGGDISIGSTITISSDAAIDLNGHTIAYTGETGSVFHVTGGTLTLNDSSAEKTGRITGGKGTLVVKSGSVWTIGGKVVEEAVVNGSGFNGYMAIIEDRTDVTCGGAILLTGYGRLVMNGGAIDGNTAAQGGGICAFRGAVVEIYGGAVSNNTAAKYAGGGMFLGAENNVIDPTKYGTAISIIGNTTKTVDDLGGGGIFVDSAGTLKIMNAVITGNRANGQGGGVAGCLHGKLTNIAPETAAVYGNTASGTARVTRLSVIDHNDWWYGKLGSSSAAQDYFCAGYSVIGSRSMNGGDADWTGWKVTKNGGNVTSVSSAKTDPIVVDGVLGLSAGPKNDVGSQVSAFTGPKVVIRGNTSAMHGGGIGCNGILGFGEASFSYAAGSISIEATKVVTDDVNHGTAAGYTFELVMNGKVIETAASDANGSIKFDDLSTVILFGNEAKDKTVEATLTLREVGGSQTGMRYDTAERTFTLTATRTKVEEPVSSGTAEGAGAGKDITAYVFTDTLKSVNGDAALAADGRTVVLNSGANFNNVMSYGGLSITKVLKQGDLRDGETDRNTAWKFTVIIGGTELPANTYAYTVNGGEAQTLTNGGTISLKSGETAVIKDIPAGATYKVTEEKTGDDYALTGSNAAEGTIVAQDTVEADFENTIKRGSLSITKKVTLDGWADWAEYGHSYETCTFAVYSGALTEIDSEAPKPIQTIEVNIQDGKAETVSDLRYGTYTIVELDPAEIEDYEWNGVEYSEEAGRAEITFDDEPRGAYQVTVNENGDAFAITADNAYTRKTGELTVSKAVSGNWVSYEAEWHFVVTLKGPELDYVDLATSTFEVTAPANVEVTDEETGEATAERREVTSVLDLNGEDVTVEKDEAGKVIGITFTVTLKADESAVIKGIPVGTTYTVEEVEADEDSYRTSVNNDGEGEITTTASEAAFINSRNTPTTFLTVNKVWVDDEETHGAVTVQLLRNGSSDFTLAGGLSTVVTLSEGNGWTYTWQGLDGGYSWSAWEVEVPEGYTASTAVNGTTVTITNTEIPEEPNEPEEPENDIPDEDTPLADLPRRPEEEEDIDDPDVPLANVPQTGDHTNRFIVMAAVSGMCLLALLSGHKKDEEA